MESRHIIAHRLLNQHVAETNLTKPQDIVKHLMAMQSQEYAQAKWAIGLRIPGLTDTVVEQAFNEGKILRTHVLRPTWHFVTPSNIRWLLTLTAPRVHAFNKTYYKKYELDTKTLGKCTDIIIKQLEGGNYLTRKVINEALEKRKIVSDGIRLSLIMMYAELEGFICSGPRQGKQFTYALLDERAPAAKLADRETLLADFTYQYFDTRGPATLQDLSWWSGLSMKEVREGAELVKKKLTFFTLNDKEYLFNSKTLKDINKLLTTFLMPDYDEYGISYRDRNVIFPDKDPQPITNVYYHTMIVDGIMGGTWKPIEKNKTVTLSINYLKPPSKSKQELVNSAIRKYGTFIGKELLTN